MVTVWEIFQSSSHNHVELGGHDGSDFLTWLSQSRCSSMEMGTILDYDQSS